MTTPRVSIASIAYVEQVGKKRHGDGRPAAAAWYHRIGVIAIERAALRALTFGLWWLVASF
jgi:hypothetical protein